jgi:hypothetical protein
MMVLAIEAVLQASASTINFSARLINCPFVSDRANPEGNGDHVPDSHDE